MRKNILLILTLTLILTRTVSAEGKPQLYMPYPIVFVSGIGTRPDIADAGKEGSPAHDWPNSTVFKEMKKYYLDNPGKANEAPKYEYEISALDKNSKEVPHMEFLFYDGRQATLATNAGLLRDKINKMLRPDGGYYKLSEYNYTDPCSTPKVILVCHSFGGLIARYMLVNDSEVRNKVAAVFFIGTPQQGSPLAVIGYFLPKEIPYLAEDIKKIDIFLKTHKIERWRNYAYRDIIDAEKQKIIGNLRFMNWCERGKDEGGYLYTSTRDAADNEMLRMVLAFDPELLGEFNKLPQGISEKGAIKACLINNMSASDYKHTFVSKDRVGASFGKNIYRTIPSEGLSYDASAVLLSILSPQVEVDKIHAIVGDRYKVIKGFLSDTAASKIGSDFHLDDYSFYRSKLWENGDGVVNLVSQGIIGQPHQIDAAHTGNIPLVLVGETNHSSTPNIILEALDDPPEIVSVRAVPVDWGVKETNPDKNKHYIIFKVKDYLLADIEIDSIKIDGEPVALPENFKGADDKYKPYNAFKGSNRGQVRKGQVLQISTECRPAV